MMDKLGEILLVTIQSVIVVIGIFAMLWPLWLSIALISYLMG